MNIHNSLATTIWIYPEGSPQGNAIITRGATDPRYVPVATEELDAVNGIVSKRNHFGLAVAQTRNCEWYFDDLQITSFASKSPKHLFRFHAGDTEIASDSAFEVNYYGCGYDPVQYLADGNTGHSQTLAQI